jgi:hypothetical protein
MRPRPCRRHSCLSVSLGIVASRDDFPERDRSPVAAATIANRFSNAQALPPFERAATGDRSRSVWLRLLRVALYRRLSSRQTVRMSRRLQVENLRYSRQECLRHEEV